METAKQVGYVCRQMYNVTKTGLGPELVHFNTVPLVGGNEDIWIKVCCMLHRAKQMHSV